MEEESAGKTCADLIRGLTDWGEEPSPLTIQNRAFCAPRVRNSIYRQRLCRLCSEERGHFVKRRIEVIPLPLPQYHMHKASSITRAAKRWARVVGEFARSDRPQSGLAKAARSAALQRSFGKRYGVSKNIVLQNG